jgi:hypothetical protein
MRKIVAYTLLFFVIFTIPISVYASENNTTEPTTETTDDNQKIITSTVQYENLTPGKEYTVSGVLMNNATNQTVFDRDGNPIQKDITFTPEKSDDYVNIEYNITNVDIDQLEGDVSIYEQLNGQSTNKPINNHGDTGNTEDLSDILYNFHAEHPYIWFGMSVLIMIFTLIFIMRISRCLITGEPLHLFSSPYESYHPYYDNDDDEDEEDNEEEPETDEITNTAEYKDDDYYDLDNNTHMFVCKSCGQKFILQDTFEGFVPKCPNCGDII